jgi:NAD(P)-dependent dehydrogenase (short-subunit alcohol dehydrogenase family)
MNTAQGINQRCPPTVLITGAAGDIGNALAETLGAQGQSLVLADHSSVETKLEERAQALRATSANLSVITATFDVTDRAEVAEALSSLAAKGFVPNLVFNNAGYQGAFSRVDRMDSADVAKVLAVNVLGVFNVVAETSARLIALGESGAVVNTASMAGVGGAPNMAGYSASKAAVIALTKSSAKDLAPFGIRVNAVSPAFIGPGAMWDRQVELQAAVGSQYYATDPAEVAQQMISMVPLRRYGSLAEVASVVAFLLSDAASYLTGVNIEISGGSA